MGIATMLAFATGALATRRRSNEDAVEFKDALVHSLWVQNEQLRAEKKKLIAEHDKLKVERDALQTSANAFAKQHAEALALASRMTNAFHVAEDRLAVYEGRREHPMSHLCCVPARADLLLRTALSPDELDAAVRRLETRRYGLPVRDHP